MKLDNSLHEIRVQMWHRGGNFVQKLAACLGAADLENQAKLIAAFPEIIERYDAMATLEKQQQPELSETEVKP